MSLAPRRIAASLLALAFALTFALASPGARATISAKRNRLSISNSLRRFSNDRQHSNLVLCR